MKKTLLAAALTGALISATSVQAAELATDEQKLGYSLGLILGEKLKADIEDLDIDAFRQGMEAIYTGAEPKLSQEEVSGVMQAFQMKKMEEQRAAFAKLARNNFV